MKLIVPSTKPRNPFAPAASRRRAGAHRAESGALRQQAQRRLRREIATLPLSP